MNWNKLSEEIENNNWNKSDITKGFCINKKGSPLFFLQKGKKDTGENVFRVVFNKPLANESRLNFEDISEAYDLIKNEKRTVLNNIPVNFKDNEGYNMQFNDMSKIFSDRFWEDSKLQGKEIKSASFSNENTAQAFFSSISKNLINDINQHPDKFEKIKSKIESNFDYSLGETKKMII